MPPQASPSTGEVPHEVGSGVKQSAVQLPTGVLAVQLEPVLQLVGLDVFGGQFTGQNSPPIEPDFTGKTSMYMPNDPVAGICTFSLPSGLGPAFGGLGVF